MSKAMTILLTSGSALSRSELISVIRDKANISAAELSDDQILLIQDDDDDKGADNKATSHKIVQLQQQQDDDDEDQKTTAESLRDKLKGAAAQAGIMRIQRFFSIYL